MIPFAVLCWMILLWHQQALHATVLPSSSLVFTGLSMPFSSQQEQRRQSVVNGTVTVQAANKSLLSIPYRLYHPPVPKPSSIHASERHNANMTNDPRIIIGVLSDAKAFSTRQLIRSTWASSKNMNKNLKTTPTHHPTVLFLVGQPTHDNQTHAMALKHQLEKEFATHQDLLVVDYPEAYRHVIIKVLAFFHALTTTTINTKLGWDYALKVDDDTYVQTRLLQDQLVAVVQKTHHASTSNQQNQQESSSSFKYFYAGVCHKHQTILRPAAIASDFSSKWSVSVDIIPSSIREYPPYALGAGYILSASAVQCLVHHMADRPYFPNEDAFVGWILQDESASPSCRIPCTDLPSSVIYSGFAPPHPEQAWIHHRVPPRLWKAFHDEMAMPVGGRETKNNSIRANPMQQYATATKRPNWTTQSVALVDGLTNQTMEFSYHHHPRLMKYLWNSTGTTKSALLSHEPNPQSTILLLIHSKPISLTKREMIREQVHAINQLESKAKFQIRFIFVLPTTTPSLEFEMKHSLDMVTIAAPSPKTRRRHKKKQSQQRPLPIIGLLQSLVEPSSSSTNFPFDAILRISMTTALRMRARDYSRLFLRARGKDYAGNVCRTDIPIHRSSSHSDALPSWLLPNKSVYDPYAASKLPSMNDDDDVADRGPADDEGDFWLSSSAARCLVSGGRNIPLLPSENKYVGWYLKEFCNMTCQRWGVTL